MIPSEIVTRTAPSDQLPELAFTRGRVGFDPRLTVWDWKDGAHRLRIDFDSIPPKFGHLTPQLKRCLVVFAAGYSASYVGNLFDAFMHFAKANEQFVELCPAISPREVSRYRASLEPHQAWRVGALNPLLQRWFDLALPGVEEECVEYLQGHRKPGNVKGEFVRTRNPEQGPFSEKEFRALFRAVDTAYGAEMLPEWVAVLFRLLAACGGRISQYASLKIVDFAPAGRSQTNSGATLQLPQVKTGQTHSRESFLTFDIAPQTARVVSSYLKKLEGAGSGPDAPLFSAQDLLGQLDTRDRGDLFFGHFTSENLQRAFSKALRPIAPLTERLEFTQIPISPRRFRYTFGTRMAEEGCSMAVIADRLGHTDLQNVGVYFEASPAIVENIDRAMDAGLAPIAEAFRGRLIDNESQATLHGAPGSRIIDFRTSATAVGSCGKDRGCGFNKPVACYTCFKFEPWVDAPHEQLLERLEAERSQIDDLRLATINDDAIIAIREVIAECKLVHKQRAERAAS